VTPSQKSPTAPELIARFQANQQVAELQKVAAKILADGKPLAKYKKHVQERFLELWKKAEDETQLSLTFAGRLCYRKQEADETLESQVLASHRLWREIKGFDD
jgi:hypothetical protein